jgi:hypothetical protein
MEMMKRKKRRRRRKKKKSQGREVEDERDRIRKNRRAEELHSV